LHAAIHRIVYCTVSRIVNLRQIHQKIVLYKEYRNSLGILFSIEIETQRRIKTKCGAGLQGLW